MGVPIRPFSSDSPNFMVLNNVVWYVYSIPSLHCIMWTITFEERLSTCKDNVKIILYQIIQYNDGGVNETRALKNGRILAAPRNLPSMLSLTSFFSWTFSMLTSSTVFLTAVAFSITTALLVEPCKDMIFASTDPTKFGMFVYSHGTGKSRYLVLYPRSSKIASALSARV